MKRALCVWFPTFTIDLLRRRASRCGARGRPDRRVILVAGRQGQKRIVMRCCDRAAGAGVRPGLSVSEAQALLREEAHIEEWDPEREKSALRAVAMWAHRFSPLVSAEDPNSLLIDSTGTAHLFGGEHQMAEAVLRAAQRIGLQARIGAAATFGCARAVVRGGASRVVVVPDGEERSALRDIPLEALGLDETCRKTLEELGVERIGQLMELPRAALPSRFGDQPLRRLGEALGESMETIEPMRPVAPPGVERLFDGPTTRWEAIEAATLELLERLCLLLHERESGLRLAEVTLSRIDAPPVQIPISLSAPSRNTKHLWSLLRPRLERANMGDGVERIALCAKRCARLRHEQSSAWREEDRGAGRDVDRAFGELVDTLVNRLGPDRTLLIASVSSHAPERTFALHPATAGARATRLADGPEHSCGADGDRPFVLLDHPECASVMGLTPDGPALSLRWREEDRRIVASVGPERIGAEWWRGRSVTRDYFKVQDDTGRWLWLCRVLETGAWFVHGVWA